MDRFPAVCLLLLAPALLSAQNQQAIPTLHANSNLVVVDVVVTDSHHNPVHGLTVSDFTLLEGKQAQSILSFEEHSAGKPTAPLQIPKLPEGVFTNATPYPANETLNVLVLDTLNTPMRDQRVVRGQLLQFLKDAPHGSRIAIFGLSQSLHILQGFTTDPEVLRNAISGSKGRPKASPMMDNAISGDTEGQDNPLLDMLSEQDSTRASLEQFLADQKSFQNQMRIRYTLDAFNMLGRWLSALPGHKNLIWFSGSFPVSLMPDGDLKDPFSVAADFEDEFRETVNLLSRAQAAVYPIDARGLATLPMYGAENSGKNYASHPDSFGKDLAAYNSRTAAELGTMQQMAEATGGRAFLNTNDLKGAVQQAIETGSNYYTLAYRPTDGTRDGSFRRIRVLTQHQGLQLAYRRGYYADTTQKSGPSATVPGFRPLQTAMMRGTPEVAEIPILLGVRRISAKPESTLANNNTHNEKVNGPYYRYLVSFVVHPANLQCNTVDANALRCELEFVSNIHDDEHGLVVSEVDNLRTHYTPQQAEEIRHQGIIVRQEISVPVRGEYILRAGLYDHISGHIGTVEIPLSRVAGLAPIHATKTDAPQADTPRADAPQKEQSAPAHP